MYHKPLSIKSDHYLPDKCLLCGGGLYPDESGNKICLNQYCEAGGLRDIYRGAKKALNRGARTIHALIFGPTDLTAKARGFLDKHKDEIVESATIQRVPINSAIQSLMDVVTLGTTSRVLDEQNYDALFHLSIIFDTNKDNYIRVEKNQVINMELTNMDKQVDGLEEMAITGFQGKTIGEILENTKRLMGRKFAPYQASTNNCQVFLLNICRANGAGDSITESFIKQNTRPIFESNPHLRPIANVLTGLRARVAVLEEGAGIKRAPKKRATKPKKPKKK